MMKRNLGIAALALAASGMFAESALAKNLAVGPLTCRATITGVNRTATIQAAVDKALPGDVIYVCPGNYPEQVVIRTGITLRGESDGTGNLVVITVPPGGLVPNATSASYGGVAAQVLVQDTSFVKVLNLAVDGTTTTGTCSNLNRSAGIFYLNVGVPADNGPTAGSIGNVVVRDHADPCLDLSSQAMKGLGILTENSNIVISDSNVHTIRGDGISQLGGFVDITRNVLMDVWDYAVKVVDAASSDVRTNTINHSTYGVFVNSPGTDVVSNVIGPDIGTGINVAGGVDTLVTSNRMYKVTTGIELNASTGATVTGNIVQRSGTGIIDKFSRADGLSTLAPNVIKNNEVNEANVGISSGNTGIDVLTPNTFTNVGILTRVEF